MNDLTEMAAAVGVLERDDRISERVWAAIAISATLIMLIFAGVM